MPFFYSHPGQPALDLEDMPLDSWITIQTDTGKTWPQLLGANTIGDAVVAKAIIAEACKVLGVDPPPLTLRQMLDRITFRDVETVPTQFDEGLPDPKATATDQAMT